MDPMGDDIRSRIMDYGFYAMGKIARGENESEALSEFRDSIVAELEGLEAKVNFVQVITPQIGGSYVGVSVDIRFSLDLGVVIAEREIALYFKIEDLEGKPFPTLRPN